MAAGTLMIASMQKRHAAEIEAAARSVHAAWWAKSSLRRSRTAPSFLDHSAHVSSPAMSRKCSNKTSTSRAGGCRTPRSSISPTTPHPHEGEVSRSQVKPRPLLFTEEAAETIEVEAASVAPHNSWCSSTTSKIINSPVLELVIDMVILSNVICITFEQTYRVHGKNIEIFNQLEHVFLSIYVLELLARFAVLRSSCLQSGMFVFDLFIVFVGVAYFWVARPVIGNVQELSVVLVLRIARLFRVVRALRLFFIFRELWMLVQGLINALRTMLFTLILLLVILYAFAIVTVEILRNHNAASGDSNLEFKAIIEQHFNDLPTAMLTLLQFVTFDNIEAIYGPLVGHDWTLLFLFGLIMLVVGIVFMNLVTAVIVNGALEQASRDLDMAKHLQQLQKEQLVADITAHFAQYHSHGSVEITREEVEQLCREDNGLLSSHLHISEPIEIFDALDIDRDQRIKLSEFIEGVWHAVIAETPIFAKRLEKQMAVIRQELHDTCDMQMNLQRHSNQILKSLADHLGAPYKEISEKTGLTGQAEEVHKEAPAGEARDGEDGGRGRGGGGKGGGGGAGTWAAHSAPQPHLGHREVRGEEPPTSERTSTSGSGGLEAPKVKRSDTPMIGKELKTIGGKGSGRGGGQAFANGNSPSSDAELLPMMPTTSTPRSHNRFQLRHAAPQQPATLAKLSQPVQGAKDGEQTVASQLSSSPHQMGVGDVASLDGHQAAAGDSEQDPKLVEVASASEDLNLPENAWRRVLTPIEESAESANTPPSHGNERARRRERL